MGKQELEKNRQKRIIKAGRISPTSFFSLAASVLIVPLFTASLFKKNYPKNIPHLSSDEEKVVTIDNK